LGWEGVLLEGLTALGLIAVPTFLFLSGGFLVYALQGKDLKRAYRTVAIGLFHMLVPYFLWSIGFYILIFALLDQRYTLLEYLKNLVVGYPYNFVPLVACFYLASPILVPLAARRPWFVLLAVSGYQLFTASVLRPDLLGFALPDWARYLTIPGLRLSIALWGVFFPMGVVFGQRPRAWARAVRGIWWLLAVGGVVTFSLAVVNEISGLGWPLAGILFPVLVISMMPLLRREMIPFAQPLEELGRRAYGLYLANLVLVNLVLVAVRWGVPWLYGELLLLIPVVLLCVLVAFRILVAAVHRLPFRAAPRVVFG
jgi:peptidoglycan/LPS O-acetylase OafA/YrhL